MTALFEDREGSLWIGTAEGLIRLRQRVFSTLGESDGLDTGSLLLEKGALAPDADEAVLVDLESLVEPESRVERKGTDKGPGAIALALEKARQGRQVGRKTESRVVTDPVLLRVEAGEDVGVGRESDDVVGTGIVEPNTCGSQPVHLWRRPTGVAVGTESIDPQGVDGAEVPESSDTFTNLDRDVAVRGSVVADAPGRIEFDVLEFLPRLGPRIGDLELVDFRLFVLPAARGVQASGPTLANVMA